MSADKSDKLAAVTALVASKPVIHGFGTFDSYDEDIPLVYICIYIPVVVDMLWIKHHFFTDQMRILTSAIYAKALPIYSYIVQV